IQTDSQTRVDYGNLNPKIDYEKVLEFLTRTESIMSNQLMDNIKNKAFEGYTVEWEEQVNDITKIHYLTDPVIELDFVSTDISWNVTGSTIISSYGRYDHSSWCSHKGIVCAWNLSIRDFNPEKATFIAESSSCVMCIEFHPIVPSLVVAGTFSGDITLWRIIENQDPVVAHSITSEFSHQEPISQIQWIPKENSSDFNVSAYHTNSKLVSIGYEGKVIIWEIVKNFIQPIKISHLHSKLIPKLIPVTSGSSSLGLTTFTSVSQSVNDFLVGTETGFILRYSNKLAHQVTKTSKRDFTEPNPITFTFSSHIGPIQAISYSPFHRNLFLSAGSDGLVHLHHILAPSPILSWDPSTTSITSVQWSHSRPCVFACTTANGNVYIYDLIVDQTAPIAEFLSTSKAGISTSSMAFNKSRNDSLAIGDVQGGISIWRLKSTLSTQNELDQSFLDDLGSVSHIMV
ncbi:WD40-repeat-containing domain protein, partial [Globomyces pollinis-pini]